MADDRTSQQGSYFDRLMALAKDVYGKARQATDPDFIEANTYDMLRKRGIDDERASQMAADTAYNFERKMNRTKTLANVGSYFHPIIGPTRVMTEMATAQSAPEFIAATPIGGLSELAATGLERGYEKGKEFLGYSHGGNVGRHGYQEGGPPEEPAEKTAFVPPTIEIPAGYSRDERTLPIEDLPKLYPERFVSYAPPAPSPEDAPAARAISRAAPERGERLAEGTVFQYDPLRIGGADDVWQRMIQMESGGKHFDRYGRPLRSPAGAIGIAQVMPGTGPIAASYANLPWDPERYYNDPAYNLKLGRAYYERQLAKYGDPILAAAAYNTGPGNLDRALRRAQETGRDWRTLVHPETQKYVRFVAQVPQQQQTQVQRQAPAPVQVAQATQNDATPMRSGVFAFGTNDPNPDVTLKSAQRIWEQSQRVGIQPIFVLPNPNDARFAPMAQALKQFADKNGIKYEVPTYEARDPLHMTPKSAQDIAARYPGAVVAGDSNSWRIQKYGYNRPVAGPNTFVDQDSEIMLGRVGAGSPEIAGWFTNYADYLSRQKRKNGGETKIEQKDKDEPKLSPASPVWNVEQAPAVTDLVRLMPDTGPQGRTLSPETIRGSVGVPLGGGTLSAFGGTDLNYASLPDVPVKKDLLYPTYGVAYQKRFAEGGRTGYAGKGRVIPEMENPSEALEPGGMRPVGPTLGDVYNIPALAQEMPRPMVGAGSKETKLYNEVLQSHGKDFARRVQRAADEVPHLGERYSENALRNALTQNDRLVMTMKPSEFLKAAMPMETKPKASYIRELADIAHKGGFSDVPWLEVRRLAGQPVISGHEGRHRSKALELIDQPTSLVQLRAHPDMKSTIKDLIEERHGYVNPYSQMRFMKGIREQLPQDMRLIPQGKSLDEFQKMQFSEPYKKGGSVVEQALVVISNKAKRRRGRPD